jgi:hypothetical protein
MAQYLRLMEVVKPPPTTIRQMSPLEMETMPARVAKAKAAKPEVVAVIPREDHLVAAVEMPKIEGSQRRKCIRFWTNPSLVVVGTLQQCY